MAGDFCRVWPKLTRLVLFAPLGWRPLTRPVALAFWHSPLSCTLQLGLVPRELDVHLPLTLLPEYLALTRALQTTYNLEPAGSHGVWGLDDFSFLPFLFGAAQLVDSPVPPSAVCTHPIPPGLAADYLYFDAVAEIYRVKGPGLSTHSPMLYNVSGAAGGWTKVAGGMLKMYRAEVWGKRVVVQHLGFGRLFPWTG